MVPSGASPSITIRCSSVGTRSSIGRRRSRNACSVTTTRLPASVSRYSICSGEEVLYMEKQVAPTCMAAQSQRLKAGRLTSMKPTTSPRFTPRASNAAARLRTVSAYSPQLASKSESLRRSAGWSERSSAVIWNASHIVVAPSARGCSVAAAPGWLVAASISNLLVGSLLPRERGSGLEGPAGSVRLRNPFRPPPAPQRARTGVMSTRPKLAIRPG